MSLFFTSFGKCADVPLTHDRRLVDIFLSYVPFRPLANPPLPSYQPLAKPIKLPKPHKVSITSLLSLHSILPVSYPLTHFTPQPPLYLGQITSPAPRGMTFKNQKVHLYSLIIPNSSPVNNPSKPSHQFPQWLV